jgi:hypothetical protein
MQQTVTIIDNEKKQTQPYAAWIGLDWADQKHFWSMRTAEGKLQRGELDNTPEAIEIWASTLEQRFAGQPVALAIEQARGAVISMPIGPVSRAFHRGGQLPQDLHPVRGQERFQG